MTLILDDSGGVARTISTSNSSLDFATPREEQSITGMTQAAQARLQLLADFSGSLGLPGLDDAANSTHDVCKDIGTTSVARTITIALSGQQLQAEVFLMDYQWSRAQSGELAITVPFVLADGTAAAWSTP